MFILVKILDSRLENSYETSSFRKQCNYANLFVRIYERYLSKGRVLVLQERIFLREVNKIRNKPKVFSSFLGNDKERETVGFLADTVYHLNDVNVKQEGEKHATLDLITTTRPFKKKLSIFKHFIKMNVVIFRGIWGNKSKKIPNLFNLFKSSLPILPNSLVTLLFENSCCFFLKTVFRDRHYRILN